MDKHHTGIRTAALALALAATSQADAQSAFTVRDEASGQRQIMTSANARFFLNTAGNRVIFAARDTSGAAPPSFGSNQWTVTLVAPPGEKLRPGLYPNVGCPGATFGRVAGLEVTENNPKCFGEDNIWGWLTIRQIEYNDAGQVIRLEASYSQRVGSATAPAWTGLIRYEATPQLLRMKAPSTSSWGPVSGDHHSDSSLFSLSGNASGAYFEASVRKDYWNVALFPPSGQTLRKGRFTTRSEATAQHAGFNAIRGLESPKYCPQGTGVVDVLNTAFDNAGTITGLHARFEYRCAPGTAAMRGEVRYGL
ncbi:hypothetical protein [Cognatilysobacter bugurensis]|uniref:Uncharacterized protein n=1 Tax=Cognatilysobacter bugurensis TaxID=543356 RepID=A0A918SSD6_9GAMM|nr:hypothetical protein [Lysobacter bugurensis]GHA69088.1 hypothetical protein GCM10007067_01250 [Lysobacter bugurensis]